jgi:hypothetical protein
LNFMGNTKELLLAYPSMKQVTLTQSVNVMLPPQFYTLKKEALPLRYAFQAKKIAPSLFDGLLEEGKQYDYMVWKEGEEWVFLAYDMEIITTFLKSKGFNLENVSKIFFVQQAAEHFDKPFLLDESEALVSLDDTVAVIPRSALSKEESSLAFDESFTPKKGVMLQGSYGSVINMKQAVMLAAVLVGFGLMFFVEGWRYSNNAQSGEAQMQELLEAYPSLQSKYTRESIMTKYKTIDSVEREKRELIKAVSGLIFKGVTLTSLQMNEKLFTAQFECKDAKVAKRVKTLAEKKQLKATVISGSNDVKIEGAL